MVIGTEMKDEDHERLIKRVAHSEARTFIVQASSDFPFEVFEYPAFRNKAVIGIVEWAGDLVWPGLSRVLHDSASGGRLVAEHLWELGHRHVLCVDSPYGHGHFEECPPYYWAGGHAFVCDWTARGGRWQAVTNTAPDRTSVVLGDDLVACFSGADAPTAVFGVRDWEAWLAQRTIRERLPDLDGRIAIVGYGGTPWSEAGSPPFTSVSYELEQIAAEALKVVDAIRAGQDVPAEGLVKVAPKLIVRETSVSPA
jgi:LacI family transcriptional regulator